MNGNGYGALYVKVSRNGEEIDDIKTEHFVTATPSTQGAVLHEYVYVLDTSAKTITLKQFNGTSWENVTETAQDPVYTGDYSWTWRDKDGNTVTQWTNGNVTGDLPTSGKVIYIDGDMINKKIIADVTVEI